MTEYRVCVDCSQALSLANYYVYPTGKPYIRCKLCHKLLNQANRKKNAATYTQTAKRKYWLDPEIARERSRKWASANRDKVSEINKKYAQKFPEKMREKGARRRARAENNGIFFITSKEKLMLYNSACFYCGGKDSIQIDHVIPIARGGRHSIGNLVAACAKCNNQKKARFIMEWRLGMSGPRRKVEVKEREINETLD
jgi:5-methylcytosine-specific restriction endonuclease McrA